MTDGNREPQQVFLVAVRGFPRGPDQSLAMDQPGTPCQEHWEAELHPC